VKSVYLDYAATTPVAREVLEAMAPYFRANPGNPSSSHGPGLVARNAVEQARASVAKMLGCSHREVYFTSGGTEADNLAIMGTAWAQEKKKHIVTSAVEHHAVLRSCQFLEKNGWKVTYLPVDTKGMVDPSAVRKAIRRGATLVTIMHANNEVGTIQPIAEIGAICREAGVRFHTDAVQTAGHIPISVDALNVDLLSISGHKFYGPKGVGALYIRQGTHIAPLFHGGGHERGRRSGTENVPGVVGLGRAAELAMAEMPTEDPRQAVLRDKLLEGILERVPNAFVTGSRTNRLPNNASVIATSTDGAALLHNLDDQGISASSGSACTSGSLEPSHVLLAMGFPPVVAFGSLRLSIGRDTTEEDIDYVLPHIAQAFESAKSALSDNPFECDCVDGECG
jgi:cysteine desulfurase